MNNRFKEAYDRIEQVDSLRDSVLEPGVLLKFN
jgi:hypothetical protein